ncbi:MAG: HNH endonuclease [Thermoguttaceae bacterium]|jgi:5-methylcytosine-specific restriction endonuclease McrA
MKFELKPDNRNSSDEDLIKDLISVAKKLGKETVTRDEYDKHGRYSEGTLRRRFDGWLAALERSGLSATKDYYTDEQLINELQRIAKLPGIDVLSRETFKKYKKISSATNIERRFGSWSKALKKAGLSITPSQSRYSNEDLFKNLLNTWTHYGRQPTVTEMSEHPSKITPATYSNRFGNWRKALEAFVEYVNKGEKEGFNKEQNVSKENINNDSKNNFDESKNISSGLFYRKKHKTSRTISWRMRFLVTRRDDFKCRLCGNSPALKPGLVLHVDHIIPWSEGGETVMDNLQTLCEKCNIGKSNLPITES